MSSLPQCRVPLRTFLGSDIDGKQVSILCATSSVITQCTAAVVVCIALLIWSNVTATEYLKRQNLIASQGGSTINAGPPVILIPRAVALLPLVYVIIILFSRTHNATQAWETERMHLAGSEMGKASYLSYRAMDDARISSSVMQAVVSGALVSTTLLGPTLRWDR